MDDNATNGLILVEQLGAWGIRTDAVDSGERALSTLRGAAQAQDAYDLALLDMCMTRMDGLELARRISRDPTLSRTSLLLLTSAADVSREEAIAAGIAESLTKPVRLSQLGIALQNVRGQAHQGEAARKKAAPRIRVERGHVLIVEDHTSSKLVAVGILEHLVVADLLGGGVAVHDGHLAVHEDRCVGPAGNCLEGFEAVASDVGGEPEAKSQQHIPIIAMTAGAVPGDRERCLAAGMDSYVTKPITPSSLDHGLTQQLITPDENATSTDT